MNTKCEIHATIDAKAVCHHCGKPLCNLIELPYKPIRGETVPKDKLCGYTIEDPAFISPDEKPNARAVHCEGCLMANHRDLGASLERLKASL